MTINSNMLKGKIVEKGLTLSKLAEEMGVNKATLYRKFKNNGETLLVKDAHKIVVALELSKDEIVSIFFTNVVA